MKKNSFYGMMMFAAALLTAGCTADYADSSQGLVPIYLTATVNEGGQAGAATRAAADLQGAQLASGTTFAAEFTGSDVTVNSVTYTADGNGGTSSVSPSQPCFKFAGQSTTVHAYVPQKPTGTTFSVQADQSTDAAYKQSDLMYATTQLTKTGLAVTGALQFQHKMAKIICNVSLGSGVSSITKVEIIGGYRTVNITDATTCALGTTLSDALSTNSAITIYSGTHSAGTLNCAALLPPQTVTNADFLVITTDMGDITYSLDSKAFATSQSYTFNATVTAAAVGTTTAITDWVDNGSATVNPTVETGGLKAIDLGLSVKWANMNVGATSETDYGMYFMWGDVAGHPGAKEGSFGFYNATDGFSFAYANYKWGTSASKMTKYNLTDRKTTLEAADDAATANWGSGWRMPTREEFNELLNNTTIAWTTDYNDTGVSGYTFTANGQTLFLPNAGYRSGTSVVVVEPTEAALGRGWYWSSTAFSTLSYYLRLDRGMEYVSSGDRYVGYTVRPVLAE